jgi:hypothetical protein
VVGWAAAAAVVAAYALLSAGRLSGDSLAYQWLNLLGAAGLIVNAAWNGAWPSTAVNVIWAGIGLAALTRLARRERRSATPE